MGLFASRGEQAGDVAAAATARRRGAAGKGAVERERDGGGASGELSEE
jgi:hypothetical protein